MKKRERHEKERVRFFFWSSQLTSDKKIEESTARGKKPIDLFRVGHGLNSNQGTLGEEALK